MIIQPVVTGLFAAFFDYCKKFGRENDESFLYDEDLTEEAYHPGPDEPAYLLLSDENRPAGAASLMIKDYRARRTARFRVFHTLGHDQANYRLLLEAILPHCAGLDTIFLFVSEAHQPARRAFESLGFTIERYSWLLCRSSEEALEEVVFPEGFTLRPFDFERDAQAWCLVRNTAFKILPGQVELRPDHLEHEMCNPGYFPEGMLVLLHGEKMVGIVQAAEDTDTQGERAIFIYNLAILPGYQHRGLGRRLLRAAVRAGQCRGIQKACLAVNAENEKAAALYLAEGFRKIETMVCYQYRLAGNDMG